MDFNLGFAKPMLIFVFLLRFGASIDTVTPTRAITDGDTIVSAGEKFTLGFFSPNKSTTRYVGIWYSTVSIQTVVWVANREKPVNDSSGILKISDDGNLVLIDGRSNILWSTNLSISAINSSAKIFDSGNVILSKSNGDFLWQSFDYPTNTLLPDMKLGVNLKTGLNWSLTSWKSPYDPGRGEFSYQLDPQGKPQFFIMKEFDRYFRSGPWNGLRLSGTPQLNPAYILNYSFISDNDEIYYTYNLKNDSIISRLKMDDSGQIQRLTWINDSQEWNFFWFVPADACDNYATCGVYSSCSASEGSVCACLRGFEPKSPQDWYLTDTSGGCVRKTQLECGNRDGFYRLENVKVPDTTSCQVDLSSNLDECREQCLNNCSCSAYGSADIRGEGSGCLNWYGDLVDLKVYSDFGETIYIRITASELGSSGNKKTIMISVPTVTLGMLVLVSFGYFSWRRKRKGRAERERYDGVLSNFGRRPAAEENYIRHELEESSHGEDLQLFDLDTVIVATNYFSSENKLGEGGFGPVYKGSLANGEEIAVKRLSKNSGQGTEEFKTEFTSIAKLQHRNLVRLRGCCIQGEERMLIYEYMPNKSLDSFIFDRTRRVLLDWRQRFDIIIGIARGILYLHQDSRLRIIHRDLKSSNILLDAEMNPKISDFGMARIFEGNQTQANTNRVVGTHGYMAPEYAMDGLFSVKSDVFSFGVILLEIVGGRKNSGYYQDDPSSNLIGHVWNMWKEGRGLELLDSFLNKSCRESEVLRCIQVGLLCVQERPADRPSMSSAIFLLSNETIMPKPKQPMFYMKKNTDNLNSSTSGKGFLSINEVTVTMIQGR